VVAPVDAVVVLLARGESEEPEEGSCDEDGSAQTADGDVGNGGGDGPEQDVALRPPGAGAQRDRRRAKNGGTSRLRITKLGIALGAFSLAGVCTLGLIQLGYEE
jgi:hypothetical protein